MKRQTPLWMWAFTWIAAIAIVATLCAAVLLINMVFGQ